MPFQGIDSPDAHFELGFGQFLARVLDRLFRAKPFDDFGNTVGDLRLLGNINLLLSNDRTPYHKRRAVHCHDDAYQTKTGNASGRQGVKDGPDKQLERGPNRQQEQSALKGLRFVISRR
jgi:hypothetical protein